MLYLRKDSAAGFYNKATGLLERNWRNIMSALSISLPDSLNKRIKEIAQRDKVSINQMITLAVAEKLSAL
jgi:predicted DNA-binding ribbon-helix-helix protein